MVLAKCKILQISHLLPVHWQGAMSGFLGSCGMLLLSCSKQILQVAMAAPASAFAMLLPVLLHSGATLQCLEPVVPLHCASVAWMELMSTEYSGASLLSAVWRSGASTLATLNCGCNDGCGVSSRGNPSLNCRTRDGCAASEGCFESDGWTLGAIWGPRGDQCYATFIRL